MLAVTALHQPTMFIPLVHLKLLVRVWQSGKQLFRAKMRSDPIGATVHDANGYISTTGGVPYVY